NASNQGRIVGELGKRSGLTRVTTVCGIKESIKMVRVLSLGALQCLCKQSNSRRTDVHV
ncbi:hypothetical protein BaRGS_00022773, partial [Batillaria attramentaria]